MRSLALLGALVTSLVAAAPVAAASGKAVSLGRFQDTLETVRPYVMLGLIILAGYVLINRIGHHFGALMRPAKDGAPAHRDGLMELLSATLAVIVLVVLAYGVLYYGIDVLNAVIEFVETMAATAD